MIRHLVDVLFREPPLLASFAVALAGNIAMFAASVAGGGWAVRRWGARRTGPPPPPVGRLELLLVTSSVLLNAGVAAVGIVLWREGVLVLRDGASTTPGLVLLDVLVLFGAMDLGMYLGHRLAHHPWFFPWVHRTHHRYDRPRPLTLFVLNPFEVLGFGGLWIAVLLVHRTCAEAVVVFLVLNLVFGTLGHLGVEPAPARWTALPGLRHVSTSTFHAEHHADLGHNFGFYTLIWDRLFGTLSPTYVDDVHGAREGAAPVSRVDAGRV